MSSQTLDDVANTAEEQESFDNGVIDDQAIDRKIASAFNLPVDDLDALDEIQGNMEIDLARAEDGTPKEQPLPSRHQQLPDQERQSYGNPAFDNNGQFDDRGFHTNSDMNPGMHYYRYASDKNYGNGMNSSPMPREACRGSCLGICHGDCHRSWQGAPQYIPYANEDSRMGLIPYNPGAHNPSTNQYHNAEHPNQLMYPMYQAPQQFSGEYSVYEQNGYSNSQNSNSLISDYPLVPTRRTKNGNSNMPPSRSKLKSATRSHRISKLSTRPATNSKRRDRHDRNLSPPFTPPPFTPSETESDAVLEKKSLTRGTEDHVAMRGSGVNDPENIRIVNMRDNEKRSWGEISNLLNADRIQKGANPQFTPNNVHNRYNRNAPVLCAAEGVVFIPVKERKKMKSARSAVPREKLPNFHASWSNHFDEILVQSHNQIKAQYWKLIAEKFEENGGFSITAEQAAYRMRLI